MLSYFVFEALKYLEKMQTNDEEFLKLFIKLYKFMNKNKIILKLYFG